MRLLFRLAFIGIFCTLGTVSTITGFSDYHRTQRTQAATPVLAVIDGVIPIKHSSSSHRTYYYADYTAQTAHTVETTGKPTVSTSGGRSVRIHTRLHANEALVGQAMHIVQDPQDPGYGEFPGYPNATSTNQYAGAAYFGIAAVALVVGIIRRRALRATPAPAPATRFPDPFVQPASGTPAPGVFLPQGLAPATPNPLPADAPPQFTHHLPTHAPVKPTTPPAPGSPPA